MRTVCAPLKGLRAGRTSNTLEPLEIVHQGREQLGLDDTLEDV
jgi:hypothetical protein